MKQQQTRSYEESLRLINDIYEKMESYHNKKGINFDGWPEFSKDLGELKLRIGKNLEGISPEKIFILTEKINLLSQSLQGFIHYYYSKDIKKLKAEMESVC